jgi:hypothetical protein
VSHKSFPEVFDALACGCSRGLIDLLVDSVDTKPRGLKVHQALQLLCTWRSKSNSTVLATNLLCPYLLAEIIGVNAAKRRKSHNVTKLQTTLLQTTQYTSQTDFEEFVPAPSAPQQHLHRRQ